MEVPRPPIHLDDYNASYRDNIWLGQFELNHQTVLYYFAGSPWYDKSCNNEILKMQRRTLDHLVTMTGIEYELQPNESKQLPQNLYVIHKKNRTGPRTASVMAIYYVLDQTIYQAPNTYTLLTSRLKKCSFRIHKAFKALSEGVRFSPTEGYSWDFSTEEKKEGIIPSEQLATKLKRKQEKDEKIKQNSARVDSILFGLVKKYAPDVLEKNEPKNEDPPTKRQKI